MDKIQESVMTMLAFGADVSGAYAEKDREDEVVADDWITYGRFAELLNWLIDINDLIKEEEVCLTMGDADHHSREQQRVTIVLNKGVRAHLLVRLNDVSEDMRDVLERWDA